MVARSMSLACNEKRLLLHAFKSHFGLQRKAQIDASGIPLLKGLGFAPADSYQCARLSIMSPAGPAIRMPSIDVYRGLSNAS